MKTLLVFFMLSISAFGAPPDATELEVRQIWANYYKKKGYDFDIKKMSASDMEKAFWREEQKKKIAEMERKKRAGKSEAASIETNPFAAANAARDIKAPQEIRNAFANMGNRSTKILIGTQRAYAPLNMISYRDLVRKIAEELPPDKNSGIQIEEKSGRKIATFLFPGGYFALKQKGVFPEANAAIGLIPIEGEKEYLGVLVVKVENKYVVYIGSEPDELISKEGWIGFDDPNGFVKIESIEFDSDYVFPE